jgi:hypothetical protein
MVCGVRTGSVYFRRADQPLAQKNSVPASSRATLKTIRLVVSSKDQPTVSGAAWLVGRISGADQPVKTEGNFAWAARGQVASTKLRLEHFLDRMLCLKY